MIKTYNIRDLSVDEILAREENAVDVSGIVAAVIENIRKNGDAALAEYTEKFDKVKLDSVVVTRAVEHLIACTVSVIRYVARGSEECQQGKYQNKN